MLRKDNVKHREDGHLQEPPLICDQDLLNHQWIPEGSYKTKTSKHCAFFLIFQTIIKLNLNARQSKTIVN